MMTGDTASTFRELLATLLMVTAAIVIGCRSLPQDFDPPEPSYAVGPATQGPLAAFAAASRAQLGPQQSGFLLLHRNDEDFLTWIRLR